MMLKCEILLHCKRFSHFSSKINSVIDHVVGTYLRVDVLKTPLGLRCFEQPVPDHGNGCLSYTHIWT